MSYSSIIKIEQVSISIIEPVKKPAYLIPKRNICNKPFKSNFVCPTKLNTDYNLWLEEYEPYLCNLLCKISDKLGYEPDEDSFFRMIFENSSGII